MLALLLGGCSRSVNATYLTAAPWRVADIELEEQPAYGFGETPQDAVDRISGACFRFYPDGAATFVLASRFHSGSWILDSDSGLVTVDLGGGQVRRFLVVRKWPDLLRIVEEGVDPQVALLADQDRFDYRDRDIYSAAMNLWRVPLSEEATDKVLQLRARSMLRYLTAYFEAASIKNLETVNVSGLSTPFKFAANGIALKSESNLPMGWIVLFSAREDCTRMNRLIGELFRDVVMPDTKNRYLRFASIFRQMDHRLTLIMKAE